MARLCRSLALPNISAAPRYSKRYSSQSPTYPQGFIFWPKYFSMAEQRTLLAASLHKLDTSEMRHMRKRRRDWWDSRMRELKTSSDLHTRPIDYFFAPDDMYEFQEGHYDGVIHHFREAHLPSWPIEKYDGLLAILDRLHLLCPTMDIQTHVLHLASHGYIGMHVDNIDASGSWILGVSLGDERVLKMKAANGDSEFYLNLPSGSVYLQRDYVRYNYLHGVGKRAKSGSGQRLSIMIRVRLLSII
ncbi:hypothetical protein CPB84DRAFT_1683817 [Gymnopilus junonius]|uniref:Alpha-ketoglutarate-dependent dioxygenase AlkB-like domain-containing protein n=1 Tax=Gymnopilus junonius TaxID=109634 RepID=A0A9P5NK04_GYMJU|nr:hypothetical protein CPB84DRAFT_1683817 [Gymnopilus junonius]